MNNNGVLSVYVPEVNSQMKFVALKNSCKNLR